MSQFKSVDTHGAGPPIQVPADSKPTPDEGGPAFPRAEQRAPDGALLVHAVPGMSLRDWFAGQALSYRLSVDNATAEWRARLAYQLADAMIAARKKGGAS